jgi:hypothetical protein
MEKSSMSDEQPMMVRALSPQELAKNAKISEDFYTVFSNLVRISASATEFRIFFGETYPTASGETKVVENFCVVVTPAHAKAAASILVRAIEQVEAMFGTIATPRPLREPKPPETPHEPTGA